MSHFTVLVIGDNPEQQLKPFQENNMGDCPKEYLKFNSVEEEYREEYETDTVTKVVMPDGRLLNKWDEEFRVKGSFGLGTGTHEVPVHLEQKEVKFTEIYPSFDEYITDWYGYEKDQETGLYGYWENPNAKWDWYSLGGRWSGMIKLKYGASGVVGCSGVFGNETGIDQAKIKDIANLDEISTFAVLKDGVWYEKGQMGWWGAVLNGKEEDKWKREFQKLLRGLHGETLISIYDCHI